MRKNIQRKILFVLLLFVSVLVLPAGVHAKCRKQLAEKKTYDRKRKIIGNESYSYNKKGYLTGYKEKNKDVDPCSFKISYRFYKNGKIKRIKEKDAQVTIIENYNKKGILTSKTENYFGDTIKTTYKNNKKYVTEATKDYYDSKSVWKFNRYGHPVSCTVQEDEMPKEKTTFTTSYRSGVLKKLKVIKNGKTEETFKYDSHGNIKKYVEGNQVYTMKNTYKGGYLTKRVTYINGKKDSTEVFTYTRKKYPEHKIKKVYEDIYRIGM